jgi:hypothetical protein
VLTGTPPERSAKYPNSLPGVRGARLYFAGQLKTGKLSIPGVEIRGGGAYVLAPASVHPSGVEYSGSLPKTTELWEVPDDIVDLLAPVGASEGPAPPRTREWYPALEAAGLRRRGPYQLRHTFATEALAAGISIFELARVMGASVKTIDKHYGHLARDSEQAIRARSTPAPGVVATTWRRTARGANRPRGATRRFAGTSWNASDGTRTRDLRRDRPRRRPRRTTIQDDESRL